MLGGDDAQFHSHVVAADQWPLAATFDVNPVMAVEPSALSGPGFVAGQLCQFVFR